MTLYLVDPATGSVFPPCLFRTFLGLRCPGCGSLRALHQLLHLNGAAAFSLNPLVTLALPVMAVVEVGRRLSLLVESGRLTGSGDDDLPE